VNNTYRTFLCASLALAVTAATGCPGDSDDDSGASATVAGTTTDDTGQEETAGDPTGDPTGTDPLPNGEQCTEDAQCESEMCFVVGVLGGVCGDCLTDADCPDGGCSIPNPLKSPPEGASCNMGEQGGGCMSDDVCQGDQTCAVILDVPGVFTASTCSECNDSSTCDGDDICNPHYDVAELSGHKSCVAPGSVALGAGCVIGDEGHEACASGFCATATVMGLLELGVCSECVEDGDCAEGETCSPPDVDLATGLVAGTCG
jgi:hypothetical protein